MEKFDFLHDDKFKAILERDYLELESLVKNKLSKSILVLSGSLIETLLMEFLSNKPPKGYTSSQILKLALGELIDLAEDVKLISKKSKDLSSVIRDYRNLIHPGRELRKKDSFDFETASVSFSLLNIIIKEIRDNYLLLYGYSAKDVIQKILNDSNSIYIFDKLIEKLSAPEKARLLNTLITYDDYIQDQIHYIHKLLKYVHEDVILEKLGQLLKIFETDTQELAIYHFKLFSGYIGKLNDGDVETIVFYILHYLRNEQDTSKLRAFYNFECLSVIGDNLKTTEAKELFLSTLLDYYYYRTKDSTVNKIYMNLMGGIDSSKRLDVETYLKKECETYSDKGIQRRFRITDDLPF